MWPQGKILSGFCSYNADLLDESTVERMLDHFRILLRSIAANPEVRISELNLFTVRQRQTLLLDWNKTDGTLTGETVHQAFEALVRRHPQAIAVEARGVRTTYDALNRRANRIARLLARKGLTSESVVGLCFEDHADTIAAMLGILKAGGAYLAIDQTLPEERLQFLGADSQFRMIVTASTASIRLPGVAVIRLAEVEDELQLLSDANPESGVTSGHLAYVIYTSGSTGRPKGVGIEHEAAFNMARGLIDGFLIKPDSRILQFASPSFDASIAELLISLLGGATLCLVERDRLIPGKDFLNLLSEQAISFAILTPTFLTALPDAELPGLKVLVSAGEACSAELVERWAPGRVFINAYGPTEVAVCATLTRVLPNHATPSIGRPILNKRVYVLDPNLNPAPLGGRGELFVGGIGLARCYLNRPDLTAERFVPDPFSSLPGARLYRTGDLVRWLNDGQIEFIGRVDHQVKLRGYRIEPGEIEAHLRCHPGIREARVFKQLDPTSGGRLLAFWTRADCGAAVASPAELRDYLSTKLPRHMIPERFVRVTEIPLTASGKTDTDRLLAIAGAPDQESEEARLGIEESIRRHPSVREAAVALCSDDVGRPFWCVYAAVDEGSPAAEKRRDCQAAEHVDAWEMTFDTSISAKPESGTDPQFNIAGWRSVYDGLPIPEGEMRTWASDIVARVASLQPRRVLEIGCGTGLLLFKLAPACELYHGVDFSRVSLDYVRGVISQNPQRYRSVVLEQLHADDMTHLRDASFDVVLLNSVVQYFPDVSYLIKVIEHCVRLVRPGGAIVFGDIRNYRLLHALHASVEASRVRENVPISELRARVQRRLDQEGELCLDPRFFPTLRHRFPQIGPIAMYLQRGRVANELNKYRYHAVLYMTDRDCAAPGFNPLTDLRKVDASAMDLASVRQYLESHPAQRVCLLRLGNSHVAPDVRLSQRISGHSHVGGVEAPAIAPEDLYRLGEELGYDAAVCWSAGDDLQKMDACFLPRSAAVPAPIATPLPGEVAPRKPWSEYANDPTRAKFRRAWEFELRQFVRQQLHSDPLPVAVVLVGGLIRDAAGNPDWHALPPPTPDMLESGDASGGPRNDTEKRLMEIWSQLLGFSRFGVTDNFFRLGGHSLLVTQLIARIRKQFSLEISINDVFERPTVASLGERIEAFTRLAIKPDRRDDPHEMVGREEWQL